ncbi:polyubiquitin-C-like [Eucalyptus grandis]|uniref:polyubiquitin-C-like n=1 Tax=Eucalyptus grandis TaxID=71139 RepID=UPI00192ED866|nr:polyubiquitin-C-like [Eucalyptus grandis]
MIQTKEGIRFDEFALIFGGKMLAEDRTLASLDLLPELTFHLVFHPKDDVSIIIDMSSHRVTLGAKSWYTVCDVKAIAGALMSAQLVTLHSHMFYQGKLLEDHKTLACHSIADGSVLQLVFPFQIFVKCLSGKTFVLQVCKSDTVKEVKNNLRHKLQEHVPSENLKLFYVGKSLVDDLDLVNLYLITKTVALKAGRDSTVKHIKASLQDTKQINEHSQLLFSFEAIRKKIKLIMDRRLTLPAKSWDTVRDVKAIVGAWMSAQVMESFLRIIRPYLLQHCGCLFLTNGVSYAPFQVYRSHTAKEVKNKLYHKLQLPVPAEWHHISYVGKMLAGYSIEENSILLEIISLPRNWNA